MNQITNKTNFNDYYLEFAKGVYAGHRETELEAKLMNSNNKEWEYLHLEGFTDPYNKETPQKYYNNKLNGFAGTAYKNIANGEIVVAFRGTEPPKFNDMIMADLIGITLHVRDFQFESANKLYEAVANQNPNSKITICGHSLGGALTQLVGSKNNVKGYSYNGPGMAADSKGDYNSIVNYCVMNDFVANLNTNQHIGEALYIRPEPIAKKGDFLCIGPHCNILDYTKNECGKLYQLKELEGFNEKIAWALWYYDSENENFLNPLKAPIGAMTDDTDLEKGIKILKKLNLSNVKLNFKSGLKKYSVGGAYKIKTEV